MSDLSKKRRKKFFGGAAKKSKYALNLCPGIKGFLCTHNGHPKFCIRDAYNILDEFSGPTPPPDERSNEDHNKDDDFEAELKRDIENVQNESKDKEFQVVETGVAGCIFIKSASCNPSGIMETIIQRIIDTGKCRSRKILRMLPIQVTCKAYLDDIKKAVASLFDNYFKGDAKTFAIVVNRRNNSNVLRDELIHALGLLIRDRNPFHSADLKKPQLTVLVEILKSVCCLAVIPDYNKHKKYNLVELGFACQSSSGKLKEDHEEDKSNGNKNENQGENEINTDEVVKKDCQNETKDDNGEGNTGLSGISKSETDRTKKIEKEGQLTNEEGSPKNLN